MLIGGIIILTGGICGLVASAPKMDTIRSGLGQFVAGLDAGTAREFQIWQSFYYGSIVLLVIGGILLVGGVIERAMKKRD